VELSPVVAFDADERASEMGGPAMS
jgi:hypothetical protein